MEQYSIERATKEDIIAVENGLVKYNLSKVPKTQEENFIPFNKVIKDENNNVIAGIVGYMYGWHCLYIDMLWVDDEFRCEGLGSILLTHVEKTSKEQGCKLIHLDTFDFQAKDFYVKHGFSVFGELKDCPEKHSRFYLSKRLL